MDMRHHGEGSDRDEFLTTAEVAALLRTPEATLRYWRHLKTGPPSFRLGRRVLYARGDVDAFIAQARDAEAVTPK